MSDVRPGLYRCDTCREIHDRMPTCRECDSHVCPDCAVPNSERGGEQDGDTVIPWTAICSECQPDAPDTCESCRRAITVSDRRWRHERGDRDQPGYSERACRHCAPSSEDVERLRDAHLDRLEAEAAEIRNGWR